MNSKTILKMKNSSHEQKLSPLVTHLNELRRRILVSLAALFLGFMLCFFFGQEILFGYLTAPLGNIGKELVLIAVTEGFMIQIKTAFLGGFLFSSPVVLWQCIAFILPALYAGERRMFWLFFISSLVLFIFGVAFAYTVVLDLAIRFLLLEFNAGLNTVLSAGQYLSFVIAFLLPFGFIFEIPMFVLVLTKMKITSPRQLREKRRYVILAIFVIAAILTPPDALSQIFLALPMLLLYEISIFVSSFVFKGQR